MRKLWNGVKASLAVLGVIALVGGLLVVMVFSGYLVSEDVAVSALQNQGFSNVTVVDRDVAFIGWHGGGENDDVRFTCEATNPAGKRVTIYVFAGWPFKGATIRHVN